MGFKANRLWAERAQAVQIMAALPANASAVDLVSYLFNSKPETIQAEVAKHRTVLAAEITARRAKEDAVLAAAKPVDSKTAKQA